MIRPQSAMKAQTRLGLRRKGVAWMKPSGRKVIIIGGGIAGLCAAVYAQKCGYQAEVLEMNDVAGGLAMSWRRGGYTFETCLDWLYGSNPSSSMHALWREVFDIEKLKFVDRDEFLRLEDPDGRVLHIFADTDRLEAELLNHAPQDATEIRRLIKAVRKFRKFKMPDPGATWLARNLTSLQDAPCLPLLLRLAKISGREYGQKFRDPLLRAFFGEGGTAELSAIALIFSLAWMGARDAGYAIGGSQAIIRLIEEKLIALGGRVHFGAKVAQILVRDGIATGVQLASGETIDADWVISAADGHATFYDLLGDRYTPDWAKKIYAEWETFTSYLQVSLGVAIDLRSEPAFVTRLLNVPLAVDPGTEVHQLSFRFFHFDPTFAPAGRTAVTVFLPTRNFKYWVDLRSSDTCKYRAEKDRVARAAIGVLEERLPQVRPAIEVVDVSTPASVVRYTGNWKGSMEGWLITPRTGLRSLQNKLPGLRRFLMVGQWVMPGGGLPSGPMTARPAVKAMCQEDRMRFAVRQRN
jgi:phytoene dehydrogenase-like protein